MLHTYIFRWRSNLIQTFDAIAVGVVNIAATEDGDDGDVMCGWKTACVCVCVFAFISW